MISFIFIFLFDSIVFLLFYFSFLFLFLSFFFRRGDRFFIVINYINLIVISVIYNNRDYFLSLLLFLKAFKDFSLLSLDEFEFESLFERNVFINKRPL